MVIRLVTISLLSLATPLVKGFLPLLPVPRKSAPPSPLGSAVEDLTALIEDDVVRKFVVALVEQNEKSAAALVEDKEKRIIQMEKSAAALVEDKEKRIIQMEKSAAALDEKSDERIKAVEKLTAALVEEKDQRILLLQKEILSLKGLLTARGVIEVLCNIIKPAIAGNRRKLPVTQILEEATKAAYEPEQGNEDILLLKKAYEKCIQDNSLHNASDCQSFYLNLFAELSNEIHGAPWSGPGVKNTLKGTARGEEFSCVVGEICKQKFNLELV